MRACASGLVSVLCLIGLSACDPIVIEGCESSADIKVYCGLEKPEDIEPLGTHPWLLVSELGSGSVPGNIVALNIETNQLTRLEAVVDSDSTFSQCGAAPPNLRPRGFHVSDLPNGGFRLLVVNAADGERIERYRVDVGDHGPTLTWQGCVAVPETVFPNDVASTGNEGFVVSHMYDGPRSIWLQAKFLFGIHTGYAVTWDRVAGWNKVEGTDASFPNGVEADPGTGRIFVGSTYGQTLVAADVGGGNARTVRIPVQSDNLTLAPDGRLLSVGHTGIPIVGTRGCRRLSGRPCSFPFAVVAINPETLEQEIIYEHTDGRIPGAAVALSHQGYLYMGTVFGDRVSRVRLSTETQL